MCFGRFKIQLTPLTKWPAIWILNSSAISSAMQRISKRQNATFQYHTKCHLCLPAAETHSATCWCYCMLEVLVSHMHIPSFWENGMLFFVLGACKIIMLPSRELLAWGEMHIMQTEIVAGQRALIYPCGWVLSVVYPSLHNQVAKRNVLYWGCLWATRHMICPGTNWSQPQLCSTNCRELGENIMD